MSMAEVFVEHRENFPSGERRIVRHGPIDVGVFSWNQRYFAYRNTCLHQGGPVCEGIMMHQVEDVLADDRTWQGQRFSEHQINFVCPWHGFEYDLQTGECVSDRKLKLRSYPVIVRGDDIYVDIS
jgi:nitrite reductase/ring-hydroxylating ferredoxin subunit